MRIGGGAVSIADVTDRVARDLGFVRDFWLNEIRNNRAFHLGSGLAANVGNLGHIQLFNPAASGITVLVGQIDAGVQASRSIHLREHNVALTTLVGTGRNLDIGEGNSLAEIRTVNNAVELGTQLSAYRLEVELMIQVGPKWKHELAEGEGILIVNNLANDGVTANYWWTEF